MDPKEALEKKGLVDLRLVSPGIKIDLRYATADNMTKKKLYSEPLCYLKKEAAEGISAIQTELKRQGLTLIIWDAYRPRSVQKSLWEAFPNPKYNTKVSAHNKGIAVDVTLGNKDGKPLAMPTDFDVFGEVGHHGRTNLPDEIIKNRELLKTVMEKHGFESFEFEWWHYTYSKLKDSEVLDIQI